MAHWFKLAEAPLRVTARGEWLHGPDPLSPKIAALFARHVRVEPGGSYAVCLGYESVPLQVDDTPFAVRTLTLHGPPGNLVAVTFLTSDGVEETLDPATLMQSADHVLYCAVVRDAHAVPCRFAPSHYHTLALHAEPAAKEAGFVLPLGGRRYPIGPYVGQAVPRPPLTGNA